MTNEATLWFKIAMDTATYDALLGAGAGGALGAGAGYAAGGGRGALAGGAAGAALGGAAGYAYPGYQEGVEGAASVGRLENAEALQSQMRTQNALMQGTQGPQGYINNQLQHVNTWNSPQNYSIPQTIPGMPTGGF